MQMLFHIPDPLAARFRQMDAYVGIPPSDQAHVTDLYQLLSPVYQDAVICVVAVQNPPFDVRKTPVRDIYEINLRVADFDKGIQMGIRFQQGILVKCQVHILRIVHGQHNRFGQVVCSGREEYGFAIRLLYQAVQLRADRCPVVPDTVADGRNNSGKFC